MVDKICMVQVVFAFRGYSSNRKQLHQLIFGEKKSFANGQNRVLIDVYRGTPLIRSLISGPYNLNN